MRLKMELLRLPEISLKVQNVALLLHEQMSSNKFAITLLSCCMLTQSDQKNVLLIDLNVLSLS